MTRKSLKRVGLFDIIFLSCCTLLSRVLGFFRELLFIRGLGARALSDAFLTALRIPNTIYEICAGGAFGPAMLPVFSQSLQKGGFEKTSKLVCTLAAFIALLVSALCGIIFFFAQDVLSCVVPGFSPEQMAAAIVLLRIMIFYMLTSALTALFAEALRAARHFFIPATGQILVNTIFILGLVAYVWRHYPVTMLAYVLMAAGTIQLMVHGMACWYIGYRIRFPDEESWHIVFDIMRRILPCMITSGISEIALFIELQFASYLPVGSVSLVTYASSFMRLPFGVLVHSLATVLLPELARVHAYSAKRSRFLLYEAIKLVVWVIVPIAFLLGWFSYDIFATLYLSSRFPIASVIIAHRLLIIKLFGLLFISLNHIILQLFYVRRETYVPTMVSLASAAWSIVLTLLLLPRYGVYGIAISTVLTAALRTILFVWLLQYRVAIFAYASRMRAFCTAALVQWTVMLVPLLGLIEWIRGLLRAARLPSSPWYADGFGLWLWVGPLCALAAGIMWYNRRFFGIHLYFLEKGKKVR